nr:MAG TPA: hypothetical protein [Caudoviricetes sp.]
MKSGAVAVALTHGIGFSSSFITLNNTLYLIF